MAAPISARAPRYCAPFDPAPFNADGADARAHGYGLDRNPYTWDAADRGEESQANRVKRLAWERGWTLSIPMGAAGSLIAPGAKGLGVVVIGEPHRFCGKSADDFTPWTGVAVRFVPTGGTGVVNADAVAWEFTR